MMSLVIGLTRA